jgi:hypothetical protein
MVERSMRWMARVAMVGVAAAAVVVGAAAVSGVGPLLLLIVGVPVVAVLAGAMAAVQPGSALRARSGVVAFVLGVTFAVAVLGMLSSPLSSSLAMWAFLSRGTLNALSSWLSKNIWVQRVWITLIVVTLTVNLPLHIHGVMNFAQPDSYQVIAGLFGVGAVSTLVGALPRFQRMWALDDMADVDGVVNARWSEVVQRAGLAGSLATLIAVGFMYYAAMVHPDQIVSIHKVVLAAVFMTTLGYGGQAAFYLGLDGKRRLGRPIAEDVSSRVGRWVDVFSAVTIAAYGALYLWHDLQILVGTVTALAVLVFAQWWVTHRASRASLPPAPTQLVSSAVLAELDAVQRELDALLVSLRESLAVAATARRARRLRWLARAAVMGVVAVVVVLGPSASVAVAGALPVLGTDGGAAAGFGILGWTVLLTVAVGVGAVGVVAGVVRLGWWLFRARGPPALLITLVGGVVLASAFRPADQLHAIVLWVIARLPWTGSLVGGESDRFAGWPMGTVVGADMHALAAGEIVRRPGATEAVAINLSGHDPHFGVQVAFDGGGAAPLALLGAHRMLTLADLAAAADGRLSVATLANLVQADDRLLLLDADGRPVSAGTLVGDGRSVFVLRRVAGGSTGSVARDPDNPSRSAVREFRVLLEGEDIRLELIAGHPYGPFKVVVDGRLVAVHKPGTPVDSATDWGTSEGEPAREIAAFELADELGWHDLVPVTLAWDGPLGPGSAQRWLHGADEGTDEITVYRAWDRERAAVLDYVMGNTDRNRGNYLGYGARLQLIDHGNAFLPREELDELVVLRGSEFVLAQLGVQLSPKVVAAVRGVDLERLAARLRNAGLGDYEVDTALSRLREIREHAAISGETWWRQRRAAWSDPESFDQHHAGFWPNGSSDGASSAIVLPVALAGGGFGPAFAGLPPVVVGLAVAGAAAAGVVWLTRRVAAAGAWPGLRNLLTSSGNTAALAEERYQVVLGQVRAARDEHLADLQASAEKRARDLEEKAAAMRRANSGVLRYLGLPQPRRRTSEWHQWNGGRTQARKVVAEVDRLDRLADDARTEAERIAAKRDELMTQDVGLRRLSRRDGAVVLARMIRVYSLLGAMLGAADPESGRRILPLPVVENLVDVVDNTPRTRAATYQLLVRLDELDCRLGLHRELVADLRGELDELVRGGIRWLMHPPDGTVRGERELERIAKALHMPRELVDAIARDPSVSADNPAALGGHPGRFRGFRSDLNLVRAAVADKLRALRAAEQRLAVAAEQARVTDEGAPDEADTIRRRAVDTLAGVSPRVQRWIERRDAHARAGLAGGTGGDAGSGGVPAVGGGPTGSGSPQAGRIGRPGSSPAVRRGVDSNRIRGPPSMGRKGWLGASRGLRKAVRSHRDEWRRFVEAIARLEAALAAVRELRSRFEEQAGGLLAVVDGAGAPAAAEVAGQLRGANRELAAALKERREAEAVLGAALSSEVRAASRAGLPHTLLASATGLSAGTISMLTGPWHGDPKRSARVDALNTRLMRWFNRGVEFGLPNGGQVTIGWLREQLGDEGKFLVVTVDGLVVELVGRNRTAHFDLSDGHFHPAGYDHSRPPKVQILLRDLRDAGHQGVVTFHFIPQHGKGLAPAGATFYYLVNSVLNVAFWASTPMLQMWGVFSDVRLAHEVRDLPPHLRWRAVAGTTGARMHIAGARAYLRLFTVVNPDLAGMIGETTIAKEAVTRLLGPQAIHTINPAWRTQVERLVSAAGLLRTAVQDGRVNAADLPAGLRALVTGGAERDPAQLLPVLLDHVDAIRVHLAAADEVMAAQSLLPAAELHLLDMYNPHLRELLDAVQEQGHVLVLHNDFGLARILEDFRYAAERPDGRYGTPLLALLREYPGAKVIYAHMGMGKFTTPTPGYVRLWSQILDYPGLRHVSIDISWNEVARHLRANREITDAFVELARRHHDRIIYGTDAVKPESLAQYFRQAYDLDPVLRRIRAEVGEVAWHNIRHANLERLLAAARQDVQQWAYVQLRSGAWDEIRAQLTAEHNRVIDAWLLRYEVERDIATLARPDAAVQVVGPGAWRDGDDSATAQLRNLLRWLNAVTPDVAGAKRLITRKLVLASLRASWDDHLLAREQRSAKRRERRMFAGAADTADLGLVDETGKPIPVDGLIAADQALRALDDPAITEQVLREVTRTQRAQETADREMARQRKRFFVKAGIGAGAVAALIGVGAPFLTVSATVSYALFAVRGVLNLYRTAYSQQVRAMVESILERGQFDPNTVDVLIAITRKYAILSGAGLARMRRLDTVTAEFQTEVAAIAEKWDAVTRSGTATASEIQERRDRALAAFSVLLDRVGLHAGMQYQSYPSISADAGLLGRTVNTALAATYALIFFFHLQQAGSTSGLELWVNATYALTDLLFFLQAGPAAITGWAGRDIASHHPVVRKVVHLPALALVTAANVLLTVQSALVGDLLLLGPAVVLTVATGYLAKLGLVVELGLGRLPPRKGAGANAWLNGGRIVFGLVGLLPAHWPVVVIGVAGVAAALLGLSKIDTWLATRARGPPTARPSRAATDADLARIRAEALVHPSGLGVVLAPPGDPLRAVGLELRGLPGEVTLVMHGDEHGFTYPTPKAVVRVSDDQVADLLETLLPGTGHQLNVCACSAGARPDAGMRVLNQRLGMPVVASRSDVFVRRPGRFGAWVSTTDRWVRVVEGYPAEPVAAPAALVSPAVVNAQRIGPPGVSLPIERRALPVRAGSEGPAATSGDHDPHQVSPAALSHGVVGVRGRSRIEHLLARLPVAEQLEAADPELARLSGFSGRYWKQGNAHGLRALEGLIEQTQALSIRDRVIWASVDGWLYIDDRVLAALRSGVLSDAARNQLFDHELLRHSAPSISEADVHEAAPLPDDLSRLTYLYEPAVRPAPALRQVRDVNGRSAWQAPELGTVAPGTLSRVVRIVVHGSDGYEHVGSGVLWSADGQTGYVLTNRHVIAPATLLWVEVSTPAGVRRVPAVIAPRPSAAAIAAGLVANGAAAGLAGEDLLQAAGDLDLAMVHIPEARVLLALELDREGLDHRLVLMGFPMRQLPVISNDGGVRNLRTRTEHLIVSAGLTIKAQGIRLSPVRMLDLFFDGNQWAGPGNSGGPLITTRTDDRGVRVERVAGLYQGILRIRRQFESAVGAGAIEAFLQANGLDLPKSGLGPATGDGAAIHGGFLQGEEPLLQSALREALAHDVAKPVDPAKLPKSPRGPPPVLVVLVPGPFLRERGLGRVVDHLGAYTLHTVDGQVVFFIDEMFARLRGAGLLAEILAIEIDDRVLGLRDEDAHQARADMVMHQLDEVESSPAATDADFGHVAFELPVGETLVVNDDHAGGNRLHTGNRGGRLHRPDVGDRCERLSRRASARSPIVRITDQE